MLPGIKLFDLTGRTAIITGGSKGLGLAMAAGLASAGCNIMLVNRTENEGISAATELEKEYKIQAISFAADVSNEAEMNAMAEKAMEVFGRIDILINSAGINIRGPIDDLSHEDFQKVMNINVNGTWLASRAVIPFMKKAASGKILNLASTLGMVGLANRTPYNASKGAIVNMTRGLGLEMAPFNINVNAICPGPFLTEMNAPLADTAEFKNFIVGATSLARWARMEEIQGIALLLASDASSYMCGSIIPVDGGWTAK